MHVRATIGRGSSPVGKGRSRHRDTATETLWVKRILPAFRVARTFVNELSGLGRITSDTPIIVATLLYILRLIGQILTVSLETVDIARSLPSIGLE